jgi:large subunit ribosomal protein L7/L12
MSLSCRYAAQCCARQLRAAPIRASSSLLQQQRMTRRYNSTEASAAAVNPKISAIVDQISQLTLLETADLVASLKVRNSNGHHHHRRPTNLS